MVVATETVETQPQQELAYIGTRFAMLQLVSIRIILVLA